MNMRQGMKLVSTLVFTGPSHSAFRYEIFESLDTHDFGMQIYVFAHVEVLSKAGPLNVNNAGAPGNKNAKTWLHVRGAILPEVTDVNGAETAARLHFSQNNVVLFNEVHTLF